MDIYLYNITKSEFIKFPVIPKTIEVQSPQKIDTFETLGQGDLKIIGLKGNRSFSLESFFPSKDYPFLHDRTYKGMEYVDKIEKWRATRQPMVIIISELKVNFNCVIENFKPGIQDGSGDIYYTLDIEEAKIPQIKKVAKTTKITTVPLKKGQTQPSTTTTFNKSTYGIVTAKGGVNVRSGGGIGYSKLGLLTYNSKVKLLRLEGKWWSVYYGNHGGYISAEFIKKV